MNNAKVITKIYDEKNSQKAIAEIVENCGCGFKYLIRIDETEKYNSDLFTQCMFYTHRQLAGSITKDYLEKCYDRGYWIFDESIAIICDTVI